MVSKIIIQATTVRDIHPGFIEATKYEIAEIVTQSLNQRGIFLENLMVEEVKS